MKATGPWQIRCRGVGACRVVFKKYFNNVRVCGKGTYKSYSGNSLYSYPDLTDFSILKHLVGNRRKLCRFSLGAGTRLHYVLKLIDVRLLALYRDIGNIDTKGDADVTQNGNIESCCKFAFGDKFTDVVSVMHDRMLKGY